MAALLMLLTAVDAGLGALFFGVPPEKGNTLRQRFGIPAELQPIGTVAVGFAKAVDPLPLAQEVVVHVAEVLVQAVVDQGEVTAGEAVDDGTASAMRDGGGDGIEVGSGRGMVNHMVQYRRGQKNMSTRRLSFFRRSSVVTLKPTMK